MEEDFSPGNECLHTDKSHIRAIVNSDTLVVAVTQ